MRSVIKKEKKPKQDWYITSIVGGGREWRRCPDPDFIYKGGMWSGRKWMNSSLHQIQKGTDEDLDFKKIDFTYRTGKNATSAISVEDHSAISISGTSEEDDDDFLPKTN